MRQTIFLTIITTFILMLGASSGVTAQIVISEVYGGSGVNNSYNADFVELFNIGATPINLSGYSVQYFTQAATTSTNIITLPAGATIPARGYYLVQTSTVATGGTALNLPTPDYVSPANVNLNATQGKILLSSVSTAYSTTCPASGTNNILDKVGYGTTATICNETANASAPSATTSIKRITESNNNSTDFITGAPNPQNTASPTPAPASIGGRVTDIYGRPIARAFITISGGELTEPIQVLTDNQGFYTIEGLTAGGAYIVEAKSKFHEFDNPSRFVDLSQSVTDLDFVGRR